MKVRSYSIERKLRAATAEDIKDKNNKLFYFKEALHMSRIERRHPEDYNNYRWIKDFKSKDKFIKSCRKDWGAVTEKLYELLVEENLYIEKKDGTEDDNDPGAAKGDDEKKASN